TADPDEVAEFVSGFASAEDEGAGPDGATETAGPDGSGPDPSSNSVEVVNTTTIDGLASQVSGSLDELGYGTGGLLTDPNAAYTSCVSSASADDDAAFAVSDALGGPPVQGDPGVAAGTVRVVLAEDYSGPPGEAAGVESSSPTTTSYEPLPPSIAERPTFDAG